MIRKTKRKIGTIHERFIIIEELGRRVGTRVINAMMQREHFNEVRHHEMQHAWINSLASIDSLSVVYAVFLKKMSIYFGGICITVGKVKSPPVVKRVVTGIVQFLADIFSLRDRHYTDIVPIVEQLIFSYRKGTIVGSVATANRFAFAYIYNVINQWNKEPGAHHYFRENIFVMKHLDGGVA